MKTEERLRARELRAARGLSIREIASILDVSRGTVSVWVRDIELTSAQRETLAVRNPALNPSFNGSELRARRALDARLEYQAEGRALAVYRTRIVQALYGAIQELARFDRPGWATMP
jgi:transcriptional regulator with XRE-family HTH domain